jgi:CO/xanthine dehydrogenase Mo-binding subunit
LRSQIAHGTIKDIKIENATILPGVIAVLTSKHFAADGFGPIIHQAIEASPDDWSKPMFDVFDVETIEVPSETNPLRIKAGGEAGTVPALAVICLMLCQRMGLNI